MHLARVVLLDEDDALDGDRLVLGELQHGLEVLLREILEEVRRDQHILVVVAHVRSFLCADPVPGERLLGVLVEGLLVLVGQVRVDVEDDLLDVAGEGER